MQAKKLVSAIQMLMIASDFVWKVVTVWQTYPPFFDL